MNPLELRPAFLGVMPGAWIVVPMRARGGMRYDRNVAWRPLQRVMQALFGFVAA